MKTEDVLYRLRELRGRISGGDEKFDEERRQAMNEAEKAFIDMSNLTDAGKMLVHFCPEIVNSLASNLNKKIEEAILGGTK